MLCALSMNSYQCPFKIARRLLAYFTKYRVATKNGAIFLRLYFIKY